MRDCAQKASRLSSSSFSAFSAVTFSGPARTISRASSMKRSASSWLMPESNWM
nr:MAG TPA: hypothetical protein [Caudoviricetes sp.]